MSGTGSIGRVDVGEAARRLGTSAGEDTGARPSGTDEPLLVDVREPDEYSTLRVPGAVLLPMSTFRERFEELPKDRPLLVMCARGGRSLVASTHLAAHGYADVTNVEGGITAWREAGLPTREGAPAPGEGELR